MNISIDSWHYKLVRRYRPRWNMPKSLCSYFWAVCFYLTLNFLKYLIGIAGIFYMITGLGAFWVIVMNFGDLGKASLVFHGWLTPALIAGILYVIMLVFVVIAVIFLIVSTMITFLVRKITTKFKLDSKPSLLESYLKARKEKVCPSLKYTD